MADPVSPAVEPPVQPPPAWWTNPPPWMLSPAQVHPALVAAVRAADPAPALPDVPASWFTALTKVGVLIAALTGMITTLTAGIVAVRQSWNHADIVNKTNEAKAEATEAKNQSAVNANKLDEVKDSHARIVSKVDSINKKTDDIKKSTAPPKPATPAPPKP